MAVLAATAPACRGDESAAEWRAGVNETCRAARVENEELVRSFPETPAGTIDYLRAVNAEVVTFVDELRAASVPAELRSDYERMTDEYERALRAQEKLLAALVAGDEAGAARAGARVDELGNRGDRIALRLSLRECALDAGESEPLEEG